MSVKVMGQVWELKLKPAEKYVLLAYTDHADHEGENIRPSQELIAWKTGYTVRQVQTITKKLVEYGLLEPVSKTNGKVIQYRATLDNGTKLAPRKKKNTPEKISPLKSTTDNPRKDFAPTPEIATGNGVVNPSLEPSVKPSIANLIKSWLDSNAVTNPKAYQNTTYRTAAETLVTRGIDPETLKQYIEHRRKEAFYADKPVGWNAIIEGIGVWSQSRQPRANGNGAHTAPAQRTPEEIARENEELDRILAPKDIFGTKSKENGQ